MVPAGYIKLHRQIQDHWVWASGDTARGWMDLVMLAAWEPHRVTIKGQAYLVDRGDIVASVRFLAHRWRWGIKKTVGFLARLQVDQMLSKKRNGSGNGSPSVFSVVNYELYQGDSPEHRNGSENAGGTVGERLGNETKKGKKVKKEPPPPPTPSWTDYLETLDPAGQEVLGQIAEAVASTRKAGRVAPSVLNDLARQFVRYSQWAVLAGSRVYLDRGYAAEGKREEYLVGIVRREAERAAILNGNGHHPQVPSCTPAQSAIDRATQELVAEKGWR